MRTSAVSPYSGRLLRSCRQKQVEVYSTPGEIEQKINMSEQMKNRRNRFLCTSVVSLLWLPVPVTLLLLPIPLLLLLLLKFQRFKNPAPSLPRSFSSSPSLLFARLQIGYKAVSTRIEPGRKARKRVRLRQNESDSVELPNNSAKRAG